MTTNLDDDDAFINSDNAVSVINILTKYKIKLWEMPDLSSAETTSSVDDLINKISDESGLVENQVKEILIRLQKRSITKLEDNKRFTQEGVAKFKLKIIGNNNQKLAKSFVDSVETSTQITGAEFKKLILSKFDLNCDNLKIICNGKVIREDVFLSSQNISNHSTFMVMCVYEGPIHEMAKATTDFKLIADIKDAVNILTDEKLKLNDINLSEFKIKNQNGVSLDISKTDTNHLASAMILHEKGKLLIKSKDYLKALILLAEADNEFKNCRDQSLLERVDNYALLNLDIIWCYLCLENLHELKNAEERLNTCEKCLERCYGASLERLTYLKNDSANKHIPIFVRLNLLKAILNYHKGKKRESRQALDTANTEMQKVIIDEEKLLQVMSMGFTNTEARLALRSTFNNVDAAIEQIFKKKQREKEAKKVEKQKALEKRIENTYGRTQINSKPIDINIMNDLIQFGYTEKQAAVALVRSENDFNLALDLLQSSSLDNLDDEQESSQPRSSNSLPDEAVLNQLVSMGYDLNLCKLCLTAFKNNIQKSIDFFCRNLSNLADLNLMEEKLKEIIDKNRDELNVTPEEIEKAENAQKFIDSIKKDINEDDEAYLDLNLEEDAFYINKYYSLLNL